MQRITGQGIVFLEIDGSVVDYMLAPGQQMVIDTGYLAMMDATCSLNAETVKGGAMNMFFGGEGFFNTVVTGPGKITLQTMPKSQTCRRDSIHGTIQITARVIYLSPLQKEYCIIFQCRLT